MDFKLGDNASVEIQSHYLSYLRSDHLPQNSPETLVAIVDRFYGNKLAVSQERCNV